MYSRQTERQKSRQTEQESVWQLLRRNQCRDVLKGESVRSVLNVGRTDAGIPKDSVRSAPNVRRKAVIIVFRAATEIGTEIETATADVIETIERETVSVTAIIASSEVKEVTAIIVSRAATEIGTETTVFKEEIATETGTVTETTVFREAIGSEIKIEIADRDADLAREAIAAEAIREAPILVFQLRL